MTLVCALTRMDMSDFRSEMWGWPERISAALRSGRRLHRVDDLLRRVVEVIRRNDVEAGLADDLLAEVDVGALEADDQGHLEADVLDRGDHAFGDDVAAHDAAEDVDQDALHVRVDGDDLERRGDLLLRGAAADVEEVGRALAVELDDVHRRHGEAGTVDHAADRAVERDVAEVMLGRLK